MGHVSQRILKTSSASNTKADNCWWSSNFLIIYAFTYEQWSFNVHNSVMVMLLLFFLLEHRKTLNTLQNANRSHFFRSKKKSIVFRVYYLTILPQTHIYQYFHVSHLHPAKRNNSMSLIKHTHTHNTQYFDCLCPRTTNLITMI